MIMIRKEKTNPLEERQECVNRRKKVETLSTKHGKEKNGL